MIDAILLSIVVLGITLQSVSRKSFNGRADNGAFTFSAASCLLALVVFIFTSGGKMEFTAEVIPYSILFALSYTAATVFIFLSIREGSLALSSLIVQYSLIIPTVLGFALWDEKITVGVIIGIILLLTSLALINSKGDEGEKNITPKWLLYVLIAFIGNGLCSASQKGWQMKSGGLYKNEFMIIALSISFIIMALIAVFAERGNIGKNIKVGTHLFALCGLANGIVNLLVLVLSSRMAASLMFPIISAGGIVTTYIVSLLVYKEKMEKRQTLGLFVGIISIIVLNL